ncbi:hypothetical protein [Rheinheimera sp.]|uniref:hypothetical protein n=1 Tax=Rheinheimera sp. TaxID=1869214 RepID=UPI004047F11D
MPYYKKRRYAKKRVYRKRKTATKRVSKPLSRAIKQVMKKQIETKTINVSDINSLGLANTVNIVYPALNGIMYLVGDVFSVPVGVNNTTALLPAAAPGNRIGDRVRGVGFLMDYFFHTRSVFGIGANDYQIPFIKLRITVFTTDFTSPPPTTNQLYDPNFLAGAGASLRPIDRDEGYIKQVLYDKLVIIRNNPVPLSSNPDTQFPEGNVYHWKKYFKYDKLIQYMDSNAITPNKTKTPIYMTVNAEVDEAFSGLVPSGASLLYITGRTQAWFKDA